MNKNQEPKRPEVTEYNWRILGKCAEAGVDPDIFYPERMTPKQSKAAKDLCKVCVSRLFCLEDAMSNVKELGIRGGLTPLERERLRKKRFGNSN